VKEFLGRGAERIGVTLFAALFGVFLLQVVMRYVVNRPLGWSDELALLLYPWAVFWAAAFLVPVKDHVAFDLLYQSVAPPVRRWFALAAAGVVVVLFIVALPKTADYVWFMRREGTPVLGVRYHYVFACFAIFLAAGIAVWGRRLLRLAGPGWREHV
jgi:TRAP-type C4-dicarboxylate transport system permease small subunit